MGRKDSVRYSLTLLSAACVDPWHDSVVAYYMHNCGGEPIHSLTVNP